MSNKIVPTQEFSHDRFGKIRIAVDNGEVKFVAADACDSLGLSNVSQALSRLKPSEKGFITLYTLGGPQKVWVVNEPGLYRLIFQSRKPEAEEIQDWIFYDILPSVVRTGNYIGNPTAVAPPVNVYTNGFNSEVSANWEKIKSAEVLIHAAKLVDDSDIRNAMLRDAAMLITGKDYYKGKEYRYISNISIPCK